MDNTIEETIKNKPVLIGPAPQRILNCGQKKNMGLYRCYCGNEFTCSLNSIERGHTKSCGCLHKMVHASVMTTHGMKNHRLYKKWKGIRRRCNNVNSTDYHNYGGRGIKMCERWEDFKMFVADMDGSFQPGLELDRANNDSGYSPENCRWVTRRVNVRNRRLTVKVIYKEMSVPLAELCDRFNTSYNAVSHRLRSGWDIEKALSEPVAARNFKPKTQEIKIEPTHVKGKRTQKQTAAIGNELFK